MICPNAINYFFCQFNNETIFIIIYVIAHADREAEHNFNFKHSFLSEFNSASEQAGKLELGKNKTVICFYKKNQVRILYFMTCIVVFFKS